MVLGTVWFLYNLSQESISDFAAYKNILVALFAAVGIGSCIFVQDFLAVRGLAVVFLLLAKLMVDTARWEDTPWRLVIVVWAYLFVVAGIIYVGGALGVEAVSGLWAERHGEDNLVYMTISTVEELMEMIGIIVFIHALLDYTGRHMGKVTLHVDAVGPHDAATALEICNGIVPEGGEAAEVPRRR